MPLYEYQCKACGDRFEIMQRLSDRPLRRCRKCSGRLQKLVSRTSFLLKGGGWYAEGYDRSKKTETATGSGEDKAKKEPAAKTEKAGKGEKKKPA